MCDDFQNPKISVIIPTYNRASVIQRAVNSVYGQSFGDWELILVDDGSTDQTHKLLKAFRQDSRFRYFKTENRGVSSARNLGLKQARGEWIAFLDSDDEWLPKKLEKQIQKARENPCFSIIHGDEIWIRRGVRVNPMKKHQKRGGDLFSQAVQLCCISPSTVFIKKNLFNKVGLFRVTLPVCEDYDLWLRITSRYSVGYIDDFLIKKYGGHSDQLSGKYKAMDYWRVLSLHNCLCSIQLSAEKRVQASVELHRKGNILLKAYRKHENLRDFDRIFAILNFPLDNKANGNSNKRL